MKVVIAIDSFKGSMTSLEAGEAAKRGVLKVFPKAEVIVKPLADGGEGTMTTLVEGLKGEIVEVEVEGPLGAKTPAHYGVITKDTAVIEIAEASGITLIDSSELDPFRANTYGTGELISDALDRGITNFIIGLGGSATTEAGIGMLSALGVKFYDEKSNELPPLFRSLGKVRSISLEDIHPKLKDCTFQILSDVTNPLTGENGAVAVFGPQKGVKKENISLMDQDMKHFAKIVEKELGKDHSQTPGAGAAGGLGYAFLSFLPNTELRSGIEVILELLNFREDLIGADYLITGEGRLDRQTAMGKVPIGVANLAKEVSDAKTIAFAGSITKGAKECNDKGIDAFFPIVRGVTTLEEAMEPQQAQENMEAAVEQVFRALS